MNCEPKIEMTESFQLNQLIINDITNDRLILCESGIIDENKVRKTLIYNFSS